MTNTDIAGVIAEMVISKFPICRMLRPSGWCGAWWDSAELTAPALPSGGRANKVARRTGRHPTWRRRVCRCGPSGGITAADAPV
jgi:hypothetical protein